MPARELRGPFRNSARNRYDPFEPSAPRLSGLLGAVRGGGGGRGEVARNLTRRADQTPPGSFPCERGEKSVVARYRPRLCGHEKIFEAVSESCGPNRPWRASRYEGDS